jgi:hypothetical protein
MFGPNWVIRGIVKLFGRIFAECATLGSSFATDGFSASAVLIELMNPDLF